VQGAGEPAAWIAAGPSVAYPPDLAAWGIDLGALPLVQAGSLGRALRAADLLLRSGAFGLLVLDEVGRGGAGLPLPVQTRLAGLALRHQAAVLFVTARDPGQASLGSLTSLRLGCRWERAGVHLSCRVRALKDKRRGPGWTTERPIDGLPGLR
jgi:recombination protein RecA